MDAFSSSFRAELTQLMHWRRDVRQFQTKPVDEALVRQCLDAFLLAPSVGLSEPWRIIRVTSQTGKAKAIANFERANADALTHYDGSTATTYTQLKLSGMREAPVHLAVFCDEATPKGRGLGATTMPEMRRYSVVSAITLMWLRARAMGLGLGWVSILDPQQLKRDLDIAQDWALIGYFCLGYPKANSLTPELEELNWEERRGHVPVQER